MPQQPQQQQQRPTSAPTKAPLSLAAALGYTQRPTSASQQQMALVPADSPSNFMMTQVSGHEGLGGLAPSGLRGQSKFAPTTRADPQPAPFGSQQQQQGLQAVQRRATMDGLMMRPGSAPADSSNTWHPAPSAGVAMLAGAGAAAAAQAAAPVVAPGGSQQTLGSVLAGEVELKKTNQTLEAIQVRALTTCYIHTSGLTHPRLAPLPCCPCMGCLLTNMPSTPQDSPRPQSAVDCVVACSVASRSLRASLCVCVCVCMCVLCRAKSVPYTTITLR